MNCRQANGRLVAFQDHELSPGEHALVAEHLEQCPRCAEHEARLRAATPAPPLVGAPPAVRAAMWHRLDQALDEAWADPTAHPPRPEPSTLRRLMRREARLSPMTLGAYALLLLAALGWGAHNWFEVQRLEAEVAAVPTAAPPAASLPSEQYRPASWRPGDDAP